MFHPPVPLETALHDLRSILSSPSLLLLSETARHAAILDQTIRQSGATGNLIHDAHIVAWSMAFPNYSPETVISAVLRTCASLTRWVEPEPSEAATELHSAVSFRQEQRPQADGRKLIADCSSPLLRT